MWGVVGVGLCASFTFYLSSFVSTVISQKIQVVFTIKFTLYFSLFYFVTELTVTQSYRFCITMAMKKY